MKKQTESRAAYASPKVEILDIAIERGFAQSDESGVINEEMEGTDPFEW